MVCTLNDIFVISNAPNYLFSIKKIIKNFLQAKGISSNHSFYISTGFNSIEIVGYKFFNSSYSSLLFIISMNLIKHYKLKLKTLVKTLYNVNVVKLIQIINFEINLWNQFYNFYDIKQNISYELDIYVYKLLWRFIKRYHPRRTNSWLYNKYWKCFSGIWRFYFYDTQSNSIYFLNSHSTLKKEMLDLPLLINAFETKNNQKLFCTLFSKSLPNFKGINKILFIRQIGLCNICFKPMNIFNFKLVNFKNYTFIGKRYLCYFHLIHSYCSY